MNDNLRILLQNLVSVEMLIINLITVDSCLTKKYSKLRTALSYTVFSAVFFICAFYFRTSEQIFAQQTQNGVLYLVGLVYIIPIYLLYTQSLIFKLSIMLTTWIYTMLTCSISIRFALLFDNSVYEIVLIISQTLFYAVTLKFFINFINKKMIYILKNAKRSTIKELFMLSVLLFSFIILSTYSFVTPNSHIADILLLCMFMLSSLLTYRIMYSAILHQESADSFKENMNTDSLTLLKNRNGFNDDIDKLMKSEKSFTLFFMDIDGLKHINDTYGHMTGDEYLKAFADSIKQTFDNETEFYRISGDEFVCLYKGHNPDKAFSKLSSPNFESFNCHVKFNGVSVGRSDFPKDGRSVNMLLAAADEAMYKNKRFKKQKQSV